jgi:hypothetical protein
MANSPGSRFATLWRHSWPAAIGKLNFQHFGRRRAKTPAFYGIQQDSDDYRLVLIKYIIKIETCCANSAQTSDTNYGWKFFDSIVSLSGKRSCRWQWPPTKRKAISSFSILNRTLLSGKTFMVSRLSLYPRGGELIASDEAGLAGVHTIVVLQGIMPLPVLDTYKRIGCVERFSSTKK